MKLKFFSHGGETSPRRSKLSDVGIASPTMLVMTALFILLLLLTACTGAGKTPSPLPTIVLEGGSTTTEESTAQPTGGAVAASGIVVPAQQASLAFAAGGTVQSIPVGIGQAVKAGDTLILLDDAAAQSAVKQAEADLAAAQVRYDQALTSEPARQEAALASARLALVQAQEALDQLEQNAPLASAQAQSALANAQSALTEAQRARTNLNYPRADQTTIDGAKAALDLKEDELEKARQAYDNVSHLSASNPERAKGLLDLTNAQKERDRALITLNWYLGKNSEQDLAEADANLALAQAQVAEAQRQYDLVKNGPSAVNLTLAQEKAANAQALLDLAAAQTAQVQIDLAKAQVTAAEARLEQAQTQLTGMTLTAPFDGVVASVNLSIGEWAVPGQPALELADLDQLRIETTDLSERDVPKVSLGQKVSVYIKAVNQEMTGVVNEIAPLADTLGGDVVYHTWIDLDEPVSGLKAGMTAEVTFQR
jgi:HlyD family secretion protein